MKTSIDAYKSALETGLIGQRQHEVLQFVIEHDSGEGVSQGDAGRHFNDASSSYQPRFKELEDSGLIIQSGMKKDSATGMTVKAYKATGHVPTTRVARKKTQSKPIINLIGLTRLGKIAAVCCWHLHDSEDDLLAAVAACPRFCFGLKCEPIELFLIWDSLGAFECRDEELESLYNDASRLYESDAKAA